MNVELVTIGLLGLFGLVCGGIGWCMGDIILQRSGRLCRWRSRQIKSRIINKR